MLEHRHGRHQALIDEFRAVWQERVAALDVVATKEVAVANGLSSDPPTAEEREQLTRAQAAVEQALRRVRLSNGYARRSETTVGMRVSSARSPVVPEVPYWPRYGPR